MTPAKCERCGERVYRGVDGGAVALFNEAVVFRFNGATERGVPVAIRIRGVYVKHDAHCNPRRGNDHARGARGRGKRQLPSTQSLAGASRAEREQLRRYQVVLKRRRNGPESSGKS
jgi:hypothetical protein